MQQRKTATFTYNLIRAKRKTMSLKVSEDGTLTVRAPLRMPVSEADRFVEEHGNWIRERLALYEVAKSRRPVYTDQEREDGKRVAKVVLERKCRDYADKMGVTFGRITVREQKTRWGSCSSEGNLSFNWKLVLMPEEIQDYLVVHELAHRIEMNHGPAFWNIVKQELPDYRERKQWLKQNGARF